MATMDEKRSLATPENLGAPVSDGNRGERRRRVHEILSTQRSYLDRLENELSEGLAHLASEVARELAAGQAALAASTQGAAADDLQPQLDELKAQLAAQQAELKGQLAAQQAELDQARAAREQAQIEMARMEQELRVREVLLREAQTQQEQRAAELATAREQLGDLQSQAGNSAQRQEQLRRELADERERAIASQEETKAQRRRIARDFKAQHADRLAEFERRKAELTALEGSRNLQLEAQLATAESGATRSRSESGELQASLEQRKGEIAHAHRTIEALNAEVGELREAIEAARASAAKGAEAHNRAAAEREAERDAEQGQLSQAHARIEALEAEGNQLRDAIERAETVGAGGADALEQAAAQGSRYQEELAKLRGERDRLAADLSAAEARLSAGATTDETAREKSHDQERRLQMAVEELRELKRANLELEVKLTKSRGGSPMAVSGLGVGLDWEAQKQRLLASLEADEPGDEEEVAERDTIEGTIRITDQIVAQKDLEIVELKRQLAAGGRSAASTVAEAEILDSDEIIRQERERLQQLQAEWREKIGKAEIEISVERAKLARDHAELADKLQNYGQTYGSRPQTGEPTEGAKPVRGRWLSMLGLKDVEEKQ